MSFSNIEFQEAVPFANDIRLTIKLNEKTVHTKGKGYYLEEFVSSSTGKKSSRVMLHDFDKKPIFLEIIHELNENIENIFNFVPRLRYSGTFGLLGIMLPFLLFAIGLLGYLFFKMFHMEQMFFSTEEYVIIILVGIIAATITIILFMRSLEKSTLEAIFEEEDRYELPIDIRINDVQINRNVTIYLGETWHIRTNKKKFPRTTGESFFQKEILERESILEKIRNRRLQLEKLFIQLRQLKDKIRSKSRILESKKETSQRKVSKFEEEMKELEELNSKYDALQKLYEKQKNKLKTYLTKVAQPTIDSLNEKALTNWQTKTDELKIAQAEQVQSKHILRMNERIIELEIETSDLKIKSALKDEQISEMRSLSVSATDAIKDVSIAATEEGRMRLYHERQVNPERAGIKVNINWNKILPMIIIAGAMIVLGLLSKSILGSAAEISTIKTFFWAIFGIICILGLTMMFFVFASFVRPFFTREVEVKTK